MVKFKELRTKKYSRLCCTYINAQGQEKYTNYLHFRKLSFFLKKNVTLKSKYVYRKEICRFQAQKINFCQNFNEPYDDNQRHD